MESTIYVKPERIRQYVIDLFGHYHVSKADAAMIADNLIDAEIRGVTTHGLTRIPLYTEKLISGLCDAKAVPEIVKNYGATALIDAHDGLGQVAATKAMELAIEKAEQFGVGYVGLRNGSHYGTAGYYAMMAEKRGMIGFSMTNSGAFVNPALNDVGTMLEGNIGMIFNSRPATMEMENKFGSDWDVVTFPIVPGKPQIGSGSSGYAVYSKSKNKELAVRLLFYMTSKEGQELFMKTGNCVPVKESLITSSTWKENPRSDINHEAFIWKDEYDVPAYNLLFDSLIAKNKFAKAWGEVSTALFNGDKTLSEAMRYGQEQLENIFIDN